MSINDTVQTVLRNSGWDNYSHYAAPVVAALEAREAEIAERIVVAATNAGINTGQARQALVEAGMTTRVIEPETTESTVNGDFEARLAALEALARRHLGS